MTPSEPKKIVYLFGAGATHAEIINDEMDPSPLFYKKNSLLISYLSERVIRKVLKTKKAKKIIPFVHQSRKQGNIELLISLVDSNNIENSDYITDRIKKFVKKDIDEIIKKFKEKKTFCLYKALLEFHKKFDDQEKIIGLITLNYDTILDDACKEIYSVELDHRHYCLTSKNPPEKKIPPLLKLHGSFTWTDLPISGGKVTIPIMPLGVKKNYLEVYYSFVWGRTLEILTECDILRVIGCSLSEADWGLMDLLFKAHLHNNKPFEMQIVDFEDVGNEIQGRYGFLPSIQKIFELDRGLIPSSYANLEHRNLNANVFKTWLIEKISRDLDPKKVKRSKYMKIMFT